VLIVELPLVIVELPVLPVIERYTGDSKSMASLNRSGKKMGGLAACIVCRARSEATQATCDSKSFPWAAMGLSSRARGPWQSEHLHAERKKRGEGGERTNKYHKKR
jgi:hypothetical protein